MLQKEHFGPPRRKRVSEETRGNVPKRTSDHWNNDRHDHGRRCQSGKRVDGWLHRAGTQPTAARHLRRHRNWHQRHRESSTMAQLGRGARAATRSKRVPGDLGRRLLLQRLRHFPHANHQQMGPLRHQRMRRRDRPRGSPRDRLYAHHRLGQKKEDAAPS